MIGSCSSCAYFDREAERCRRHSPEVVTVESDAEGGGTALTVLGLWPAASSNDWCGDWRAEVQA